MPNRSPSPLRDLDKDLPMPLASLIGFVVALVVVVLIAILTYRSLLGREAAANRMTTSQEIIRRLESWQSSFKDAESGQRGYLITGEEAYLAPFLAARASIQGQLDAISSLLVGDNEQIERLEMLRRLGDEKFAELEETIAQRRSGDAGAALAIVRSDRGLTLMERIRTGAAEMEAAERRRFEAFEREWQREVTVSSRMTWGGSSVLLTLIVIAAVLSARQHRWREGQAWLRVGHMGVAERIQGEQRLETLGDGVLSYLAAYLGAQVGAIYVTEGSSRFRRIAGYALKDAPAAAERVNLGEGLLGQAVKERRTFIVSDVPAGYLPVSSATGEGMPVQLLAAPATIDGVVHGALELGFFRKLRPLDCELLDRVGELLGVALRTSKDRSRLEELLEETQRQAEELQTQQEELRVTNEELEEQSRALKESQVRLETQQAELEQTNTQLEEQAHALEQQRDELTRTQALLVERAGELERSNQYKSDFLANMSHELRTPLNSSLILAKLLADNRDGNLTSEQVKFAQTISSAGHDLLALINDILDLAKIESGKVEVVYEPIDVARTIDALVKTFQPMAQDRQLEFEVALDGDVPAEIETDVQRLNQILRNLLSNALKFTERGQVSLRVIRQRSSAIGFVVRDTGIGIPLSQQDVIFEAFRQADGSTHRRYGGTGLGLSISRDLARLLGGEIEVTSVVGEGSVFTLTLPLNRDARIESKATRSTSPLAAPPPAPVVVPAATMVADDREALSGHARRVLVIEDDLRFSEILRDLAHEMGFKCIITHSAGDGLAAAVAYRPSAVLLDINLPDHSGIGVLDQLKHNPATRHVPVHVLSVADYMQEALERGAVGYDLKPVKREALIEAFRRLEATLSDRIRQVLVVEDDERQRDSIRHLLATGNVEITAVARGSEALSLLRVKTFDCMVMDLSLPDLSGFDLLQAMAELEDVSFPPVIVYTGRTLTRDEEQQLRRYSKSIIIKDARSPERLLDEVTLFLHQVESSLPADQQRMLQAARHREALLDGRRVLVVEDDARNIFALSSVLEPKGVKVDIARNGKEAIDALSKAGKERSRQPDLILMDIMMPEMDGLSAMREIRRRPEWQKIPIIALTAKAMKDDQEKCLSAGANDYIAKPLDVERLMSLIRVWMPR